MAFADTAKLLVQLDLKGDLKSGLQGAQRELGNFDKRLQGSQRVAQGVGRGIGTALKVGAGLAAVGTALIVVNVKKGVDSLHELENVTVATNTVLKSTKGVSGQTAESIRNLSEEYEDLNATMDDKVIQSGANMLLTFTNIREDAFEPALEAALNLNEAMGGGPDSLQAVAIKVGKALNDPSKGLAALSKAGVLFTDEQKDQIKALQESGDLLGAQKIILRELGTEFGGRFAEAGQTAEARMAKLGDTVEDLQQRLAGPLIPVIDRVRDKLIDFLSSPAALKAADTLGNAIANLFTDDRIEQGVDFLETSIDTITSFLEGSGKKDGGGLTNIASSIGTITDSVAGLPWQAIGDAAKLLGTGSKALLDAFLGLPSWVQTAVLTGWGLNKLTGGALSGIVGGLTGALGKWVTQKLGLMTVQAAVVNVNGPGGGVPGTGGGKGGLGGFVAGALGTAAIGAALEGGASKLSTQKETITVGLQDGDISKIAEAIDWSPGALIGRATQDLLVGLGIIPPTIEKGDKTQTQRLEEGNRYADTLNSNTRTIADRAAAQRREGNQYVRTLNSVVATRQNQSTQTQRLEEGNRYANTLNSNVQTNTNTTAANLATVRARLESGNVHLSAIERKKSSVNVTVNSTTNVSLSAVNMAIKLRQVNQTIWGDATSGGI